MKYLLVIMLWIAGFALDCSDDQLYLDVLKVNSPSRLNGILERAEIHGRIDGRNRVLAQIGPVITLNKSQRYEICVARTPHLVYKLHLIFKNENGWDDGSYLKVSGRSGVVFFMGTNTIGKREIFTIRCSYLLPPDNTWLLQNVPTHSREALWTSALSVPHFALANYFSIEKVNENEHLTPSLLSLPSKSLLNAHINTFFVEAGAIFSAMEFGITNDWKSILVLMNGDVVYEETDHISNGKLFYKLLLTANSIVSGMNRIVVVLDNSIARSNRMYLYGYLGDHAHKCTYVTGFNVTHTTPLVETHNPMKMFDFASEYFYFDTAKNAWATFEHTQFDRVDLTDYGTYNYVFSYVPHHWSLSGSTTHLPAFVPYQSLPQTPEWELLDMKDQPHSDHLLKQYVYAMNSTHKPMVSFNYTMYTNRGHTTTWMPELFTYVCNKRFLAEVYPSHTQSLINGEPFSMIPYHLWSNEANVQFEVQPPFPKGVTCDPLTGVISGTITSEWPSLSHYTITAQSSSHYSTHSLWVHVSEGVCPDVQYVSEDPDVRERQQNQTLLKRVWLGVSFVSVVSFGLIVRRIISSLA